LDEICALKERKEEKKKGRTEYIDRLEAGGQLVTDMRDCVRRPDKRIEIKFTAPTI
jgi:hypothetical protein